MANASEAYDWLNEESLESVTCAYCGRNGEVGIRVNRKKSAGDKNDLKEATHSCRCGAVGVCSVVSGTRQRMIVTTWTTPEHSATDPQHTNDLPDVEVLADVHRAFAEAKRSLEKLEQGLGAFKQEHAQLREQLAELAEGLRAATADANNSAELLKTQSLSSLEDMQNQSSKRLSKSARQHEAILSKSYRDMASKLASVSKTLDSSQQVVETRLKEIQTKLLEPLVNNMNAVVPSIYQEVKRIEAILSNLMANESEPDPSVGRSLIVTESQLEYLAATAAREAMSPLGLERIMEAYLETRRTRWADRRGTIENLPSLFDVVESALRSWEDPRRQVPSEEIRAAIIQELRQLWRLIVDWQRHNGIDRFPEEGVEFDEEHHELIADGTVEIAPSELPDTVRAVLKSGYRFRDDQELIRVASVTANLKERQPRPAAPQPETDANSNDS